MKIFSKAKDGGPNSPVDAYFIIEIKSLFSIAILKFHRGCRERFHSHAFHALTWFICGGLIEEPVDGFVHTYRRSIIPKLTKRTKTHRVIATKPSWCLTIRGPWQRYWTEYDQKQKKTITLTHGRRVVNERYDYED